MSVIDVEAKAYHIDLAYPFNSEATPGLSFVVVVNEGGQVVASLSTLARCWVGSTFKAMIDAYRTQYTRMVITYRDEAFVSLNPDEEYL